MIFKLFTIHVTLNKNIYTKEKKLVRYVINFAILLETFEKLCGKGRT